MLLVHEIGPRPGKAIDALLAGRVLVVGDDADLAAVALRLLRKDLLGTVEVAFAATAPDPVHPAVGTTDRTGCGAAGALGKVDLVPLVRDDVGGVLVGAAELGPLDGTVYVDENRVLRGPAHRLQVQPDRHKGLAVTLELRRPTRLGLLARRPQTTLGSGRADRHGADQRGPGRRALSPADGPVDVLQTHRAAAAGPRTVLQV